MSLTLLALPIGNSEDISVRGLKAVKKAQALIVENRKEVLGQLKAWGYQGGPIYELNEHTTPEDLNELLQVCTEKETLLVSDCGTPGFQDPGWQLVRLCRSKEILLQSLPGPSALTLLLSLSSEKISSFWMKGFLAKDEAERKKDWKTVQETKSAVVLMETPYRTEMFLDELQLYLPKRKLLFAAELTTPQEKIIEGFPSDAIRAIRTLGSKAKLEFMVLLYPEPESSLDRNSKQSP